MQTIVYMGVSQLRCATATPLGGPPERLGDLAASVERSPARRPGSLQR
jgi:hypothetical protein